MTFLYPEGPVTGGSPTRHDYVRGSLTVYEDNYTTLGPHLRVVRIRHGALHSVLYLLRLASCVFTDVS